MSMKDKENYLKCKKFGKCSILPDYPQCFVDCLGYDRIEEPEEMGVRCHLCIHNKSEIECRRCWQATRFKPKEKPMSKVIFESEEDFIALMNDLFGATTSALVAMARTKGYIRKDIVEEAEEIIIELILIMNGVKILEDLGKIKNAIQYLKAENERLKK